MLVCACWRTHSALSELGSHGPYILHGVYYLNDRESRPPVSTIPEPVDEYTESESAASC